MTEDEAMQASRWVVRTLFVLGLLICAILYGPDAEAEPPTPEPSLVAPTPTLWPFKEAIGQRVWHLDDCTTLRDFLPEPRQAIIGGDCKRGTTEQIDLPPPAYERLKLAVCGPLPPDHVQER